MTETTEPVIDEAKIAGTIAGIATGAFGIAVTAGLIAADDVPTLIGALSAIGTAAVTILNFLIPRVRAARARAKVTPLARPRDEAGRTLVPAAA